MDALVMCGGEGSRLREGGSDGSRLQGSGVETEKPLVEVCGRPMLDRVCGALSGSRIERVYAAVSPAAPRTREHAREELACAVVETPGEGYVADLDRALEATGRPVLTVAADLPLLRAATVDRVLAAAERAGRRRSEEVAVPSLTVCVPAALKRRLGVSVDATLPPEVVETATSIGDRTSPAEPLSDGLSRQAAGTATLAPAGVNVVADSGNAMWVSNDTPLVVNVNRPADRAIAEKQCR